MSGYGGNDTYIVDNSGDRVIETTNGGDDTVRASVSYTLSAGSQVEHLATTNPSGTTAINLTGNEFAQTIDGNAGANVIDGRGGADTMTGYGGNDTYIVDNSGDKVIEKAGGGDDSVRASVSYALSAGSQIEHLSTTNQSGKTAINLTGNEFAQTIKGNAGANVINGGGGADVLTGLGGKDVFVFKAALGAGNVDKITDFTVGQDKIMLDHTVFAAFRPAPCRAWRSMPEPARTTAPTGLSTTVRPVPSILTAMGAAARNRHSSPRFGASSTHRVLIYHFVKTKRPQQTLC